MINVVLVAVPAAKVKHVLSDLLAAGARVRTLLQEAAERRQARARAHHYDGRLRLKRQPEAVQLYLIPLRPCSDTHTYILNLTSREFVLYSTILYIKKKKYFF